MTEAVVAELERDPRASFEALVRLAAPRMLAEARRILGCDAEAQDAVQDALVSAYQALDRFRGECQITSWLMRIAINSALMRLRRRKRLAEESVDELLPTFLEDGHRRDPDRGWTQSPEALLGRKQVCDLVYVQLARLPESYRDAIITRDIHGLSTQEAARALGTSPGAMRVRLHRARLALRELMRRELPPEVIAS